MKSRFFLLVLLIAIAFSGCASVNDLRAFNNAFPPDGRYEILGPVFKDGKTTIVLGIIWVGGVRFVDLGIEAERRYKTKVDDIVNISVDEEIISALGVVTIKNTIMRGIAIKYINPPANAEGWPE